MEGSRLHRSVAAASAVPALLGAVLLLGAWAGGADAQAALALRWLGTGLLLAATAPLLALGWMRWRRPADGVEPAALAAAAQQADCPLALLDAQGRLRWGNDALLRLGGCALQDLRDRALADWLAPLPEDDAALQRLQTAVRDGAPAEVALRLRPRQGPQRRVRISLAAAADPAAARVAVLHDEEPLQELGEALRGRQRELEVLLGALSEHAIVSEADPQGRITWVNPRFLDVSGYRADELVGHTHRVVGSQQHPAVFWAELWEHIQRGRAWSAEICNRSKDGRPYWVHTLVVPFADAQGRLQRILCVQIDITAHKQAQEELRTSRELLARTSRIAGLGSWYADLSSQRLQLSQEGRAILGLDANEPVALPDLWQCFDAADAARERAREELQAMARMELLTIDITGRLQSAPGGRARWIRLVAEMDWQGGQSERMIGAVLDVTAQVRAQQRIEEEQRILRGAIDALGEAFVLFDPDDRLVYCNDKYRELFAPIQHEIFVGAFYENIVRAATRCGLFRHAREDEERWVAETMALHRQPYADRVRELSDGRWLRIIECRTVDNYHVGFRLDVTELQRALLAADAAARSKGQFLANMSHEIRTPINAILGLLQLLEHSALAPEQQDLVHKTRTAARSLLDILNDILDYSKVEAGKLQLSPEPFALQTLLDELSVILRGALGSKPLALRFEVDPALPPWLVGDALRLKQVLINLGGNAIKFTERGHVRLSFKQVHRLGGLVRVAFAVEDTSIGIAPQQQRQLFSGFSQAEASTARRFGGTGLGLAISQRLVALMGGDITLTSEPGVGSTFAFALDLPVASAAPAAPPLPAPQPAQPQSQRLRGLRLLLAEDNPLNREVALALLQREGAEVSWVADGQAALDVLTQQPEGYDLVLMDVQMPVLDGLQATRCIRQQQRWCTLPVLAMTANAMASERQQCLDAGMNAHIAKPFDIEELVAQILAHTGRAPAPAAARAPQGEPAAPAAWDDGAALARLGGDAALLQRLRQQLLQQAPVLLQAIESALARADRMAAAANAHRLKGSAAAVGAQELAAAAARAEQGWRQEAADPAADRAWWDALQSAWQRTSGAAAGAGSAQPSPQAPRAAEPAPWAELRRLQQLLERADIEAVELYERLESEWDGLRQDLAEPLRRCMQQMDLRGAAEQLQQLLQRSAW